MDAKEIKRIQKRKKYKGIGFVLPWLFGFTIFALLPSIYSFYMSLTDWGLVGPNEGFIGFRNYVTAFQSSDFWNSLSVTVRFVIWAVPLGMAASLTSALILNSNVKGVSIFRGLNYVPTLASGVAIAVMWGWIFSPHGGLLNMIIGVFGFHGAWLFDPKLVVPSYIIMAVWGAFSGFLTYLVAIKEVPRSLIESSRILGMGYFERLFKVTIPLMRPILIYNFIMAIIGGFRKFSDAYVLGGAGDSGKFYMVYFYQQAFGNFRMGYAVALAWILFVIVMSLMLIVYKRTPFWEYYSGMKKKKVKKHVRKA
ncbi:sugar ABC transporter permease [Neobacillus rhizosphaerae]|uniref:carbohydrate ABC transporter permease n=1 Tax=Neobacillus rhizosphaerae TaxID=2880965 RepID=UPI003D28BC87